MSDSEKGPDLRFSPAAKAALNEAIQDIGEEISWRAAAIANRGSDEPTLVSVIDVAAALDQASSAERKLRYRTRIMFTSMAIYGMVGLAILVSFFSVNGMSNLDPLPLIGALMVGTSIPGFTFWTLHRIFGENWNWVRRDIKPTPDELFDFLRLWISLESAIRASYSTSFGESRASLPITSMLSELKNRGLIDPLRFNALQKMRLVRNSIAHGTSPSVTHQELADLSRLGRATLAELSNAPAPTREDPSN